MAEEQDQASKTEEPTQKRQTEARERGQVARSQEVNHWLMILALTLLVLVFLVPVMQGLAVGLSRFISEADHLLTDRQALHGLASETLSFIGMLLIVPFGMVIVVAIAANVLQYGFLFAPTQIKPQLQRISPLAGLKRLFSAKSIIEFLKGIAKISLVTAVAAAVIAPGLDDLPRHIFGTLPDTLGFLREVALQILAAVLFVMIIVAMLDILFQRFDYLKNLRMTRQEVKDEYKQTEGDPLIKARLRQIRTQRARQRIAQAVPRADVVVTNPTHYAVALEYDEEVAQAPMVTAKGADLLARRIRELAEEHDVPIVENAPLARALYDEVEVDQEIPSKHYQAVAEVISFIMRLRSWKLRKKKPPRRGGV